jgi:hypothetical protein
LILIAFSLPLGGIVSIIASAMLLLRPVDKNQTRAFAFSILALSMVILFLGLPLLFYANG